MPTISRRGRGQPWSQTEKEELMWCYYYCEEKGSTDYRRVYDLWRARNPEIRPSYTANTLQTQRRNIHKSFSNKYVDELKDRIRAARRREHEENSENRNQHPIELEIHDDPVLTKLKTASEAEYRKIMNLSFEDRPTLFKIKKTKELIEQIQMANTIFPEIVGTQTDLLAINTAVYAIARTITISAKPHNETRENRKKMRKMPPWEHRLTKKVENYRKDLAILIEYQRNNTQRRKRSIVERKWSLGEGRTLAEVIEELKQKITATAQRLRRSKKRVLQYQQNQLFQRDTKKFYRTLRDPIEGTIAPSIEDLERFWKGIYENKVRHNDSADWIRQAEQIEMSQMNWKDITEEEVKQALNKTQNWKATGIDKIPNFWLKELNAVHKYLAHAYNNLINRKSVPDWLAEGRTILIPKTTDTHIPKNFRPITCLNTQYKNLTSVLANREYIHM